MNANYNTTTNDDSHHAHEAGQFSSRHSLTTNPSSLFRVAAARRGKVLLISLSLSSIFSPIALNLSLGVLSPSLFTSADADAEARSYHYYHLDDAEPFRGASGTTNYLSSASPHLPRLCSAGQLQRQITLRLPSPPPPIKRTNTFGSESIKPIYANSPICSAKVLFVAQAIRLDWNSELDCTPRFTATRLTRQ